MYLALLEIELLLDESFSLKDKRSVVKSLKDRLHREHLVSVAEVNGLNHQRFAVLGVAVVAPDPTRAGEVLDAVVRKIERGTEYRVGGNRRSVRGADELFRSELPPSEPEWTDADSARFREIGEAAIEEASQ